MTNSLIETQMKKIEVLSKKQVAALLKVDVKTIYNHVVKGTFPPPAIVLGRPRWKYSDVEAYLNGQFSKAR
jgi:predicted DNA-binding transcriptional regulator AlpA|nr:MAG TPA: helix-turn-helix domain protein [Caudoviricetes sp.]DAZ83781.1 MAG TPA: helix-turn-helix domain protein [Caudoviricetes sp.]